MNCWRQSYILSLWTQEKGGSAGRGLYHERSKRVNLFQIYNMDSGNVVGLSCRSEWIILSTEVNLCLLGKRIASYKFCFGRTCISITMKFINEVVNKWNKIVKGGVTIILFVVMNLVCVPKKRNLSIFRGLKGAWKHIRTLEWKSKNRCNSSYSGNGKIFGARTQEEGLIRIILTWFWFLYFLRKSSPVLLLPVSNRTCWAKSSSWKTSFI